MKPFEFLDCAAVPIPQANIDTDQILPARYLQKPRSDDFGTYLFRDLRFRKDGSEEPSFVLNQGPYRNGKILVAQRNFGCGSSREHAVWALYDYGFRAIIAPSFGDIFSSNALKNGLLPVALPEAAVAEFLATTLTQPGSRVKVDLDAQTVVASNSVRHEFAIDPFSKHCLLKGLDELDYTLTQVQHVVEFERRLNDQHPAASGRQR